MTLKIEMDTVGFNQSSDIAKVLRDIAATIEYTGIGEGKIHNSLGEPCGEWSSTYAWRLVL